MSIRLSAAQTFVLTSLYAEDGWRVVGGHTADRRRVEQSLRALGLIECHRDVLTSAGRAARVALIAAKDTPLRTR